MDKLKIQGYKNYTAEQFAADDHFINWCQKPTKILNKFWHKFLEMHPQKQEEIVSAKLIIEQVRKLEKEGVQETLEDDVWSEIEHVITKRNEKPRNYMYRSIGIAASFLLIISFLLIWKPYEKIDLSAQQELEWINFENTTGVAKTILLADQSTVILEPFSTLKYPNFFSKEQRSVVLQGEAFFDIARDTLKPFLIYANETITKVLGTSFKIKAFEGEETVEVDVKTGKVAVYAKVFSEDQISKKQKHIVVETDERIIIPLPNKKIEVTPNQKVVFDRRESFMIREVTALPKLITKLESLPQFQFKNESIIKVFTALEQAYGIELEFNAEDVKHCTITTKLKDESLFQKLNIICAALQLEFKQQDAKIIIEGSGCS